MLGFFVIFWFPGLAMLCVTRPLPLLPSYWMFALWDSLYCELWLTSTTSFSASQISTSLLEPFTSYAQPWQQFSRSATVSDFDPKVSWSISYCSKIIAIAKNTATSWTTSAPSPQAAHWHISLQLQSILWDSSVYPSRQYLITTATPAPDPRAVHRRSYFYIKK